MAYRLLVALSLVSILAVAGCSHDIVKPGSPVGEQLTRINCEREVEACRAIEDAVRQAAGERGGGVPRVVAYARPPESAATAEGRAVAVVLVDSDDPPSLGLRCWSDPSGRYRCEVAR